MASTGTVSLTVFETRKVIDRAFGRCKLAPQKITGEYIEIALDLLYLFLSALNNKGLPTWCTQRVILPIYDSVKSITCPLGTVDILNTNLRTLLSQLQLQTGSIYTASTGNAAAAFDNNLATACTQTAPNGFIQVQFPSNCQPVTFGVLPNATGTWNIAIQTSLDGINWTTVYSNTALAVVSGQWFWTDVQGIPESGVLFVRLQAAGGTTLNVTEFVMGVGQEIPMAKINRDDYMNLPNKDFPGRPLQYWFDKQQPQPIITLWPVPQAVFTYAQVTGYISQHVQDVGSMTQSLAIPQRWFLAVMTELARQLMFTIPEVGLAPNERVDLQNEATLLTKEAWGSESDQSPTRWVPRIWNYTR